MKPARLVILTVAVAAAGLAGYLAMTLSAPQPVTEPTIQQVTERIDVTDVLVANTSLPIGTRISEEVIEWREWPTSGLTEGFITRDERPDASTELAGAVVRLPVFDGEPLRAEKIVDSSSRIMSSLLPSGKRAVATDISVSTSAGGFILPNDRVDVVMVRRGETDNYLTEVVLSNIRVLAIDQTIQENEDGSRTAIGSTATLELTPEQTQVIAVAQQMADRLTLALRSVADVQQPDTTFAEHLLSGASGADAIQLIRSGAITSVGQ
ncbi:Flp pilus assembly protein CpaB [Georhizobium profundi]|uniref:Flp pilus assembly protein CpaB n=1 Tax=Georhizobium profundi TaxID=2341112 RepID=A0A3Q8XMX2_9HYPH|nr:Flp pilus assembly protein CpaB [Georhizobium profundi]AZN69941.1 Flp pilus assembly protein CpaB [Georhizobium profundi]